MRAFAIVALFAAAASAFTVSQNQADGVYEVYYDENGQQVTNLIGQAAQTADAIAALIERRTHGGSLLARQQTSKTITCDRDTVPLDKKETDRAHAALDKQCIGFPVVKGGHNFYSKNGCSVSFFCNFSKKDSYCNNSERAQATEEISKKCGAVRGISFSSSPLGTMTS